MAMKQPQPGPCPVRFWLTDSISWIAFVFLGFAVHGMLDLPNWSMSIAMIPAIVYLWRRRPMVNRSAALLLIWLGCMIGWHYLADQILMIPHEVWWPYLRGFFLVFCTFALIHVFVREVVLKGGKPPNRVTGGLAPTPPYVRVRIRRFLAAAMPGGTILQGT